MGLYTEAQPNNLPEGPSPLCWDVDFLIGSVKMRPGKQSAYSFGGAGTGPNGAGAGANDSSGTVAWTNPGNITAHDSSYATVTASGYVNAQETASTGQNDSVHGRPDWVDPANVSSSVSYATGQAGTGYPHTTAGLICTGFGFSIPASATITGITVTFNAALTAGTVGAVQGSILKAGGIVGTSRQTNIEDPPPALYQLGLFSDLWGSTWTPSDINNTLFGVELYGVGQFSQYELNQVQITVGYTISETDNLLATQFGFGIASLPVNGIQIGITGHQVAGGNGTLTVQLLKAGGLVGGPKVVSLNPSTDTRLVLGSSTDSWGTTFTTADINSSTFGVAIQANGSTFEQFVDYADCTVYQTVSAQNFDWVKTYSQRDGQIDTLALDSTGILWQEDVVNDPGVLDSVYSGILANTFGKSITTDDVEYIALSDLQNGTDMPRQWNGSALNRTSQVGPGAVPGVTFTATDYTVTTIAQDAAVSAFYYLLWSAGPTLRNAGNTATFYFPVGTDISAITQGSNIVIAGLTGAAAALNNDSGNPYYVVQSVGTAIGAGGGSYPVFSIVAPSTNYVDLDISAMGATYQLTLATLTTTAPVPNLQTGSQMEVAGASPSTWNNTWTVLNVLNGAQLNITSTVLAGNVATYSYTLISGTAPAIGEQVSVTGTTNGNGIFNTANAIVSGVGAGYFQTQIASPDVPSAAEQANGIINGTEFQFDPAQIIADGTGGTLTVSGGLGAGTRQMVCMFLTDSDYLTQASPFVEFTLPSGANSVILTNLPIGPPNVKARVFAFTGSNGANFFWIPEPVTVTSNGQPVTYDATIVNDNTSTQAQFSFVDAVLLAADAIDIQGNNQFETTEIGPCLGCIGYAGRMAYWGQLNKLTNFINWSFDGGIGSYVPPQGAPSTTIQTYPLGWSIDPALSIGGSVVPSPIFGDCYQIANTTGITQTALGLIFQGAYQDQYGVNIINPQTAYSIRFRARSIGSSQTGVLSFDLFSPSFKRSYGAANASFASLTSTMNLYTSTLVPALDSIPSDLQLRVFASTIAPGAIVQVDRLEVFPTLEPVLSTQLAVSYVANFEAVDQVSGNLDTSTENQQPVRTCFTLFDTLYIVKSGSLLSTQDNGTTEPSAPNGGGWILRTVSSAVGTPSVNGVDFVDNPSTGESYALIAGKNGLYIFDGGEPVPLTAGIRSLWNTINWKYGYTLWVRNDTVNRRVYVGVPLPTPNQWMPDAPVNANPTTPNVILSMNYVEVNSVSELIEESVRVSAFTGKLLARDATRKWTIWNIQAPYADFVQRQNMTAPLFLGNSQSTGKVYQLTEGSTNDDGAAINETYTTYGFVPAETGQALQVGAIRKTYEYMIANVVGNGGLSVTSIPDALDSPNALTLPVVPLPQPNPDVEIPINETGYRCFYKFSTNAVGEYFSLSEIKVALRQDPWIGVRGT